MMVHLGKPAVVFRPTVALMVKCTIMLSDTNHCIMDCATSLLIDIKVVLLDLVKCKSPIGHDTKHMLILKVIVHWGIMQNGCIMEENSD